MSCCANDVEDNESKPCVILQETMKAVKQDSHPSNLLGGRMLARIYWVNDLTRKLCNMLFEQEAKDTDHTNRQASEACDVASMYWWSADTWQRGWCQPPQARREWHLAQRDVPPVRSWLNVWERTNKTCDLLDAKTVQARNWVRVYNWDILMFKASAIRKTAFSSLRSAEAAEET